MVFHMTTTNTDDDLWVVEQNYRFRDKWTPLESCCYYIRDWAVRKSDDLNFMSDSTLFEYRVCRYVRSKTDTGNKGA